MLSLSSGWWCPAWLIYCYAIARVSPTRQGFLQIIQQASGEADYTYRSLGYASSFQLFK
jgi:hypothetical protein